MADVFHWTSSNLAASLLASLLPVVPSYVIQMPWDDWRKEKRETNFAIFTAPLQKVINYLPILFRIGQQIPPVIALPPLPLDYLPRCAADEAKLELDAKAKGGEHSAAITTASVGSKRSSAVSPSPPLFLLSSPSSASAAPRLSSSWSTCLSHSLCTLSVSASSRGQFFSTSPQCVLHCCDRTLRSWTC